MARVAIVTGGSRGIGEAISIALRDQGVTVAAVYAGNEERAREFTEHGHAYALVTYTAMLRMRAVIAAQGWARAYWANEPRKRGRR